VNRPPDVSESMSSPLDSTDASPADSAGAPGSNQPDETSKATPPVADEDEKPSTPATWVLSALWVLVFVAMTLTGPRGPITVRSILWGNFIGSEVGHAFGDVTPLELYGGQFWRALTATFIHFNLIHLVLNLIGFIQLGRIVESWYGTRAFLAIYVAIGLAANLAANLLRPWLTGPSSLIIHSGGGSTVVLGLIGLVAVVGWRNPKEFPRFARLLMAGILVANGVLGLFVPIIDNLGHASGAVAGGVIGLWDRRILRLARRPARVLTIAGLLAAGLLIASVSQAVAHRRVEVAAIRRLATWQVAVRQLRQLDLLYHGIAARGWNPRPALLPKPPNPLRRGPLVLPADPALMSRPRALLRQSLRALDGTATGLDRPPTKDHYREFRKLTARALSKPPTPEEVERFESHLKPLWDQAVRNYQAAQQAFARLRRPPPRFLAGPLRRLEQRGRDQAAARARKKAAPAEKQTPEPIDAESEPPSEAQTAPGDNDQSAGPATRREPGRGVGLAFRSRSAATNSGIVRIGSGKSERKQPSVSGSWLSEEPVRPRCG